MFKIGLAVIITAVIIGGSIKIFVNLDNEYKYKVLKTTVYIIASLLAAAATLTTIVVLF